MYCENEQGDKIIIEMQKADQQYFKDRSIYYSSFPIRSQGAKGRWRFGLKAVYTIGILDFVFDEDKDDEDTEGTWTYNGEEFDVYDFKTALRAVSASNFTDETPTGQEEISLTVHLDNEDFPTFTLTLYRLDGTNCIAAVDGKTVATVPRSQTVDLVEAINELILGGK